MRKIASYIRNQRALVLFLCFTLLLALFSWAGLKLYKKYKPKLAPYYHSASFSLYEYKARLVALLPERELKLGQGSQPIFSLLDAVGLHHKNGFSEVYGASLRFRQSGPLSVSHSELHVTHDVALLSWQPDYSPSNGATHLVIEFQEAVPKRGHVEVFLKTVSGATYLFKREFGTVAKEIDPKPLPALIPEELIAISTKATTIPLQKGENLKFVAELPQGLKDELSLASGNQLLANFGLIFNRTGKGVINLKQVSLVKDDHVPVSSTVSVGGSVEGVTLEPGTNITLILENGSNYKQQISTDARFKFENVPQGSLYSLRLYHHGRNYYGALGRWAKAAIDRNDVNVSVTPLFKNPEDKAPDLSKAKFVTPREPTKVGAIYESHARQVWPGSGTPQEYDSTTFTNNHGFVDRDRFFDNPDQCVRFVHLGSSHAVALQVRPFEKYNIELESELALRLQKCVEVVSAGRDNGDVGSNYPRIRDYAVRFEPEAILLENSSSLTMQLHPKLLRLGFGWDHDQSALDHFSYENGSLVFREWSAEYGLFATKPDYAPLQQGVPLMRTLQVPLEKMHPYGVEALTYFADIMAFLRKAHPDQRFVVHTGLDQAQCLGRCMSKLPGNPTGEVGAKTFVSNHQRICDLHGLACINPTYPVQHESKDTQLTFLFDGHYRIQGHQWLARELADGWMVLSKKQSIANLTATPAPGRSPPFGARGDNANKKNNSSRTTNEAAWQYAKIRSLPFPFKHLITFASDVDMQTPENGAAIHRLVNEQLGLPIADSVWVQGVSSKATSLFVHGLHLNRSPVEGSQHAVYGQIIREWHKGNADSFHSWQDDNVPQLSQNFSPAIRLTKRETEVKLQDAPPNLVALRYGNLRLHFSGACPSNLALRLHDDQGRTFFVSAEHVRRGQDVIAIAQQNSCVTDLLFDRAHPFGVDCDRSCFNLALLRRIDLIVPECTERCSTALVRVSRDNFSRLTVKSQLPQVRAFNLRPAFLSSHGGFTFAQNFGWDDEAITYPRHPGSVFESGVVQNTLSPLAGRKASYAYHADLLQELGTTSIWGYFVTNKRGSKRIMAADWRVNLDSPRSTFRGFYDVQRTAVPRDWPTVSRDQFVLWFKKNVPGVPADFLSDAFCSKQCASDQGSMLGLLLELSLSRVRRGDPVEHIWYTHFGSGNPDLERTESEPLPKTAISRLNVLADHYYGFTSSGKRQRVWVPPAGVAVNYRNMIRQVPKRVVIRPGTSEIHIDSWRDSVTGKQIANGLQALQELQGLTVYVPDASTASVKINGVETHSFTRNGADETGRQSITIVDSSSPQMLIDSVPLRMGGILQAMNGTVEDINHKGGSEADFVRAFGTSGEVLAEWRPQHVTLSNVSHLSLEYRKQAAPDARFFVEIEMVGGGKVVAMERGIEDRFLMASRWEMEPVPSSQSWTNVVIPLTQLQWPAFEEKSRPPIPLGRIKAVRFGVMGTRHAASTDIRVLAGLRPNSNVRAPDDTKLIGGQVIGFDGNPEQGQVVRLRYADGRQQETVTDSNGYYFFFHQVAGARASLTAGKQRCAPTRTSEFIIRRDDPEWDFDLRNCKQG